MNMRLLVTFIFLGMFMFAIDSYALNNNGPHDPALKKITISDPGQKLVLQLDYSDGCKITQLKVKGKNVKGWKEQAATIDPSTKIENKNEKQMRKKNK